MVVMPASVDRRQPGSCSSALEWREVALRKIEGRTLVVSRGSGPSQEQPGAEETCVRRGDVVGDVEHVFPMLRLMDAACDAGHEVVTATGA